MYNPSSLAQALETVPAAEQALLDSLRGPDAAHRITDDQIREIITSSAFKPRYGRDDPKSVYVDADVNTRIFFHPYDHNEITVGITCQLVFSSTTFGSNFQQAWLSVSDGEHVSTRPLSKEAFCQAIATDQFYYYETSLLTEEEYWDSEIADYMLQHNNTKGTEVEFTRDGNIKSYPPTLEQVNRAIQFFSEGEFPPFSNVEYETRMKELDEDTNIGGIVETETVSASFATEWRTSDEARKEGAGLYDKDDAPLFLNVPADVMYRSVREAIGEGYKQARMDDAKQYFIDLKDEMIGVIPKFWLDVLGSAWGKRELDRHTKRVFADTSDEVNYDVLSDHHIPHKFFFGHIEYCLQAWDDSTKFPYEVERRSISVDDVQAARQSDDALPVISGERRVHLNEVRATCVRELGEFYRMVGTDPRLKGPDMLTISQIPELVQQVGKVRDAVAEFITTAEGYWPAYTQIDGAPAEPAEGELFGVEPLAEWERELLGDPVDPRREVASIIAKVSAVHPGRYTYEKRRAEDANELVASPKPSKWAFEEVLSWLRTYVEPGYPVIFKGDAEIYIVENMVAYLQRPEGETGIYGLQEDELADGTSILTCTSEDEAMKVTVDHNLGCIALSFSRYTRRGNTWKSSWHEKNKEQAFEWFMADVAASKEPVFYFVTASDNKTRRSLVDGRELLATSLTPADILYLARQRGVNMPAMVVEKALPGQRGLLVRTNITK